MYNSTADHKECLVNIYTSEYAVLYSMEKTVCKMPKCYPYKIACIQHLLKGNSDFSNSHWNWFIIFLEYLMRYSHRRRICDYLCSLSRLETLGKAIVHLGNLGLQPKALHSCECPYIDFAVAAIITSNDVWDAWRVMHAGWCSTLAENKCFGSTTLFHASPAWHVMHLGTSELMMAGPTCFNAC